MLPSEPPEPTPSNLPFHVTVGIQTSKAIDEVFVGCAPATTRQKAGKPVMGSAGGGGSNSPDVSSVADSMLAFGSVRLTSSSHEAAADDLGASAAAASNAVAIAIRPRKADACGCMDPPLWLSGASVRRSAALSIDFDWCSARLLSSRQCLRKSQRSWRVDLGCGARPRVIGAGLREHLPLRALPSEVNRPATSTFG